MKWEERRLNDGVCNAPREEENVLYVFYGTGVTEEN